MAEDFNRIALRQKQSLPLAGKIILTQQRIREWYEHWNGNVCVSFSGGKDSTVLLHIVRSMYEDVPAVFVDTGLEYPEIRQHVKRLQAEWGNIEIVRPEMRFDEVIKKYGYPVVSKGVSDAVEGARRNPNGSRMRRLNGQFGGRKDGKRSRFDCPQWKYLLDAPFKVSAQCCAVMKKRPLKQYQKQTGRKPMIGTLAEESQYRMREWLKHGCNAFNVSDPISKPLSIWTEQDILQYTLDNKLPMASVYGEIVENGEIPEQMTIPGCGHGELVTTGCDRTGCMFCMFGCHLESAPNRFQQMRQTHPRQYDYCMRPVEEKGLGLREVLEYIGVDYE